MRMKMRLIVLWVHQSDKECDVFSDLLFLQLMSSSRYSSDGLHCWEKRGSARRRRAFNSFLEVFHVLETLSHCFR